MKLDHKTRGRRCPVIPWWDPCAHVILFIRRHGLTFQHDNARPHVAQICSALSEAETSLSCLGLHTRQTGHPLSICGMLWIGHSQKTSDNSARPLWRSGTTFHRLVLTLLWWRCVALYAMKTGGYTHYWTTLTRLQLRCLFCSLTVQLWIHSTNVYCHNRKEIEIQCVRQWRLHPY